MFSNLKEVQLSVNGKRLGRMTPEGYGTFTMENVALRPGRNEIRATASYRGKQLSDSVSWTLPGGVR